MSDLLQRFAALSMAGAVVLSLLPEGSMRRTASMAVGLMMLLAWADELLALFTGVPDSAAALSPLIPTGVDLQTAAEAAVSLLEVAP